MKAQSPAFSFYPKDVLSDERCSAMTHQEFGIHIRLLCHAWMEGSIPSDATRLQRILKVSSKTFEACWPAIVGCWEDQGGRLVQVRLERERERQIERSAINAERGRKGGRPRSSLPAISQHASPEKVTQHNRGSSRITVSTAESTTPTKSALWSGLAGSKPDQSLPFPSPSPLTDNATIPDQSLAILRRQSIQERMRRIS